MALFFETSNMAHAIRVMAMRKGEKIGMEKYRKKCMAKGMEKSVEECIEKGILKGTSISMWRGAYNGIVTGYTNVPICDITGITEDKINLLRTKVSQFGEEIIDWIENEAIIE